MIFTLEDIVRLREGWFSERQAGETPFAELEKLGWPSPIVYLSRQSLYHINQQHPDVTDFDLLQLPNVISSGLLVQEKAKPNILIAISGIGEHRFAVVMKRASKTNFDVWISSARKLRTRQTASILRRGGVVRSHK